MDKKTEIRAIDLSEMSREELEQQYMKLHTEYASACAKLEWLKEQFALAQKRTYGQSSEAGMDSDQLTWEDFGLFNEAEALRDPFNIESTEEDVLKESPGPHREKHKKDISGLPVETIVYELSPEEQICGQCGAPLSEMKEIVRTEIEVIPAKVRVLRHVQKVYTCRACDRLGRSGITGAPGMPVPLIPKSLAGPSLLAHAISEKYTNAMPFYRQEQDWKRRGVGITRNNLCHWSIRVANDYGKILVDHMKKKLFADDVIHCDETEVQVLCEADRPAARKSYIWVMANAEYRSDCRIALYQYTQTRSLQDARKVLDGYRGYIMCDGYQVYDALGTRKSDGNPPLETRPVACLVHVRRKFTDALKLIRKEDRKGTGAQEAVDRLHQIFAIDNGISREDIHKRKEFRQGELKAAIDAFFAWVDAEWDESLPKTAYGKALEYARNQKEKVLRVFEDGRLELDNSLAERTVKPFVIGRKNWLFADTPAGADASCILYSLVETAKQNGLIPYEYLRYVFEQMPGRRYTDDFIESLMPWSGNIPEHVKTPGNSQ